MQARPARRTCCTIVWAIRPTFGALYRLGSETRALLDWTSLAQRSIAEVSNLAAWLELR